MAPTVVPGVVGLGNGATPISLRNMWSMTESDRVQLKRVTNYSNG